MAAAYGIGTPMTRDRLKKLASLATLASAAALMGCSAAASDGGTAADELTVGATAEPPGKASQIPQCVALSTTASSPALAGALERVTADHSVTLSEWSALLAPEVARTPLGASGDARALVGLWRNEALALDPQVVFPLQQQLATRFGYAIHWSDAPVMAPLEVWLQNNVSEEDVDFGCLASLVGSTGTLDVAAIDSAFALDHPALASKVWTNPREVPGNGVDDDGDGYADDVHGWDFVDGVALANSPDEDSHGTHVSGLLTAGTTRLHVMGLRVSGPMSYAGEPVGERVAEAIELAAAHGIRFINRSGPTHVEDVPIVADAVRRHPEILFAFSAGNDGRALAPGGPTGGDNQYPFAALQLPNAMIVGAAERDGSPANYSSYSATLVDVAERGWAVSTLGGPQGPSFGAGQGTSMASPRALATAAKCTLLAPGLSPVAVKRLLVLATERNAAWATFNVANGVVDDPMALRMAGLIGLVERGLTWEQAALRIGLSGTSAATLIAKARAVTAE
jgi:subtilisin family serine protease